mgnify:CR=1 FL=1
MNRLHLEWVKESKVVQVFRRAILLCLGASFLGFYSGVAEMRIELSKQLLGPIGPMNA